MSSTTVDSSPFLLRGVTIVDTRSGALSPDQCILVKQGRIAAIAPTASAIMDGERVIEARGKFVIPGLLDMHTHVFQDDLSAGNCGALMLAYGVTGVRQMSGSTELLRARSAGRLSLGDHAPELLSLCGDLLTPLTAPTPEAGVAEVKRQQAEGADFIKTIFVTPKVFFATLMEARRLGLAYDGHLSPGVDVAAASKAGMKVIEHLGPTELQLIAVSTRGWLINLIMKLRPPKAPDLSPEAMKKAGKVMIANPILGRLNSDPNALTKTKRLIDSYSDKKARELAAVFVANDTWQCPTLIRNATMRLGDDPVYTQAPELRYMSRETRQFWSQVARMYTQKVPASGRSTLKELGVLELKLTKVFDEAGVKMMAGSDYGGGWVIPGVSLHQEFDLLEQAGLPPLKVLQMATLNGARFLGRESTMGTVDTGKNADLVLLDADPTTNVQNLHGIQAVVRAGVYYDGQTLTGLKEMVAGSVAAEEPDAHDAVDQAIV